MSRKGRNGMSIEVGDRVTWLHRWYGQEDEQMVGTVIDLRIYLDGVYAWVSVAGDQAPLFASVDKLTKLAPAAGATLVARQESTV